MNVKFNIQNAALLWAGLNVGGFMASLILGAGTIWFFCLIFALIGAVIARDAPAKLDMVLYSETEE